MGAPTQLTNQHMTGLVEAFIERKRGRNRTERTLARYAKVLKVFSTYLEEHRRSSDGAATEVAELLLGACSADVEGFAARRRSDGAPVRPRTFNNRLSVLSSFYKDLQRQGLVAELPTEHIERSSVRSTDVVTLTFEDLLTLLDATYYFASSEVVAARNRALIAVFMYSGLRLSEVVSLDVDQVDFERHVFRGVHRKGGDSKPVCFGDVAAEALQEYLVLRHAVASGEEPAVFVTVQNTHRSQRGARLKPRTVQTIVARLADQAGLDKRVHAHLFRHTFATGLLAAGSDLATVGNQLGHSSLSSTLLYTHSDLRKQRQAIEALEAAQRSGAGRRVLNQTFNGNKKSNLPGSLCV